jgi:hypothetical protein
MKWRRRRTSNAEDVVFVTAENAPEGSVGLARLAVWHRIGFRSTLDGLGTRAGEIPDSDGTIQRARTEELDRPRSIARAEPNQRRAKRNLS